MLTSRFTRAAAIVGCALSFMLAHTAAAQPVDETLFIGNNVAGTVTVHHVNPDGTLMEIPGSPFPSGNNAQGIAITPDGAVLALQNATAASIEELWIFNVAAGGALTPAPNSPYLVGDGPLGLDIDPTGRFLFVPSASNDELHVFLINGDQLTEATGSPFSVPNFPVEVDTTPDGSFVYVTHLFGQISGYEVAADGTLTAVPGSPYNLPGDGFELVVSPDGRNVYVAQGLSNDLAAYAIDPKGGVLTPVPGMPFPTGGTSAVNLSIRSQGDYLFVCHVVSETVTVMRRLAEGDLELVPGSSQFIGADVRKCTTDDTYLFVTDESSIHGSAGIMVYEIQPDGLLQLIPGSPFPPHSGRPQDMVVFVPRCTADCPVLPSAFQVIFGAYQSGELSDLFESDDQRLVIQQRAALTPLLPVVRVEVTGTAVAETAAELTFTLEASATAMPPVVPQRIELFNYTLNGYETVDNRTATLSDSVVEVTFTTNADRFIEPFTKRMMARLNWFSPQNVLSPAWVARIDEATWTMTP